VLRLLLPLNPILPAWNLASRRSILGRPQEHLQLVSADVNSKSLPNSNLNQFEAQRHRLWFKLQY